MNMTSDTNNRPPLFSAGNTLPFVLVTALFFLWAIPNNLNDILIKQFMTSFQITRFQAGLVQSAFYLGYFCLAMPAALLMRRFGYKTGLVTGLFLFGSGAFLFWPAAIVGSYGFFLFALFVIASGLSFLETGSNTFIAVLGDPRSSEQRLNLSQSFNPLGSITGALIGTVFIFSGIELSTQQIGALKAQGTLAAYLRSETLRVVHPYIVLGVVVWGMAILILRTKFPQIKEDAEKLDARDKGKLSDLLHYPHFLQGVSAQFFYVGAQVGTWSFLIQYIQDYTHQSEKVAGYLLTGSLVAFGVGRFAATYLMKFFRPNRLMGIYGIINVGLVSVGVLIPGWVGVGAMFLTSFFMSLMFPTIYALGIKGLGANTKLGGSFIIMAIVGGAAAPPAMGLLYEISHSMAIAMIVPLVCYAVVTHYAYYGSRMRVSLAESATVSETAAL
ncbi:MAG: L-fucose:H+ symporter permease [Acidobacteria bacterium]|nr:MAG: L-fucose:H+ symporter permease [Acidobacteriota bacterium]